MLQLTTFVVLVHFTCTCRYLLTIPLFERLLDFPEPRQLVSVDERQRRALLVTTRRSESQSS